jgi:2-methylcitrate dehydratase PrpD
MTAAPSLTRQLMDAVLNAGLASAQPDAVAAARRLLLDHLAVAAWGAQSPIATTMREHVLGDLDRPGPTLPVVGSGLRAAPVAAAMANAVAAACYEFDDTYTAGSSHPGAVVFPAALAAAALTGCDESRFLHAVVAGYEVMGRVALAVNPHAHRARHFHPTSTTGHFGAAAAAAICFDLDLDRAVNALALAGTVAGGSMQFLVEGAVTKQLHPAYAVQRGLEAAQLAARGFPGLVDPIGGARGFLAGQSEAPRPERLLDGLGARPAEITRVGIKPYPSCRNTQSPADALFGLLAAEPVTVDEVGEVRFGMIKTGVATVWDPPERTRRPRTLADAQFSMPFVAAMILRDRSLGPEQFDARHYDDPAVQQLMDRVSCVHDDALDPRYPAAWPAWVEITTKDGRTLRAEADHPRGDPENPLTDAELATKVQALTGHCYTDRDRDELADAVRRLPAAGTLATIHRLA